VTAFRVVQPWPFDAQTKDEAAAVLAAMGLTESDAFRLMMVRIAKKKALPFEPLIPNAKTIASIKEARRGGCPVIAAAQGPSSSPSMRTIDRTTRFKRDYGRERKGRRGSKLDDLLAEAIDLLRTDTPLPPRFAIIR
jgi:DNA-damage-inducible protein J